MHFGAENKRSLFIALIIFWAFFGSACGQTQEQKMKQIQEHTEKARNFRIKGDFQAALREQLKAVELNPDDDDSRMLLGGIYIELKQYENALKALQKAVSINKNNASAHYLLSWVYDELGKSDEALKEIKTASEIQSSNPNYLINLGTKYEDVNDVNQ